MEDAEELRLVTKVASLYYEKNLRQADIASQLDLSQAGVSRLLKRAKEENIVRITVAQPLGAYTRLEQDIETRYGIKEAIVVDSGSSDAQLLRNLGAAAAYYLETTLKPSEVIGISSWSETLLAMTNAMHPVPTKNAKVVQILGGVGNPSAESHAAHLTRRLANLIGAQSVMLSAPGVVASKSARDILLADPFVSEAIGLFDQVSLALVGIGARTPSKVLASSGNVFSDEELETLSKQGAVGDICLRFFDEAGKPVLSSFDQRVIGMTLEELKGVRRNVGIAGGKRKYAAIKGALEGNWINVLITDKGSAEYLLKP
ncbi:MAG: sugar-binding transcriptional regulator [Trueperaceae bacterium]|nr:sugar-binding transcriptional regulator [Trueperaceae bacterium]